jgi:hypothetical protein
MPVAETNRVVPKSILRHRPLSPETEAPAIPTWHTATPRASRTLSGKQEARTISNPGPTAAQRKTQVQPEPLSRKLPRTLPKRLLSGTRQIEAWHWTVPIGLTMTGTILLLLLLQIAWSWGTEIYDNLHYGMPRTTQVDAYVGQEAGQTPSHFIAENLHGRVIIIEFPGGNVQQARVIVGPQIAGPNADQVPVLLSFVDRHGNHQPDMLVQFGSMEIWYANEHGTFVPQ